MKRFAPVLLGIIALALLLAFLGPAIVESLQSVDYAIYSVSFLITFMVLLLLTMRFRALISGVDKGPFSFGRLFMIQSASNLFGHVSPARSGEFIKSYIMRKRTGTDYTKGIALVLAEKILDMAAICILGLFLGISLLFRPGFSNYIFSTTALLIIVAAGILLLTSRSMLGLFFRLPLVSKKIRGKDVGNFHKIFRGILKPRSVAPPFLLTVALQLFAATRIVIIFAALGAGGSPFQMMFVYFVAMVVAVISLIPGGLGSYEISGALLYTALLGIDLPTAAAALILLRLSTYAVDIPVGLACMYGLKRKD